MSRAYPRCAAEFEERAGLIAVLVDVGDVVKDDGMELVESADRGFKGVIAASRA